MALKEGSYVDKTVALKEGSHGTLSPMKGSLLEGSTVRVRVNCAVCQMDRSRREADESMVMLEEQQKETSILQQTSEMELEKVRSSSQNFGGVGGTFFHWETSILGNVC